MFVVGRCVLLFVVYCAMIVACRVLRLVGWRVVSVGLLCVGLNVGVCLVVCRLLVVVRGAVFVVRCV